MARAGIIEPREEGDGTLITEPILVFLGPASSLQIFDQHANKIGHGNEIGSARGGGQRYELRDRELRCTIRELTNPAKGLKYEYLVAGPDDRELGTINRDKMRAFGAFEACSRITSRGRMTALIDRYPDSWVAQQRIPALSWVSRAHYLLDHVTCCRFTISDEPGHAVAWITYIRPSILTVQVGYVLELRPGTAQPLRTMTLAACIVVHHTDIKPTGNGGGGGGGA